MSPHAIKMIELGINLVGNIIFPAALIIYCWTERSKMQADDKALTELFQVTGAKTASKNIHNMVASELMGSIRSSLYLTGIMTLIGTTAAATMHWPKDIFAIVLWGAVGLSYLLHFVALIKRASQFKRTLANELSPSR